MVGGRLVAQDGESVEVEETEELVARVAAIDVAKASGMVCTRVPHPAKPGQRTTKVWQVPATTNASSSWPSSWPAKGSNGSWSSPPPTTGDRSCRYWKPAA